jgi:hypothetical protein
MYVVHIQAGLPAILAEVLVVFLILSRRIPGKYLKIPHGSILPNP